MDLGILISDHNVRETMQICDKVSILSEGKMVAEGSPDQISNNDLVKEVYLGKDFSNSKNTDEFISHINKVNYQANVCWHYVIKKSQVG